MVRPILKYIFKHSVVPIYKEKYCNESVQRQAARFVTSNYDQISSTSVTSMLLKLGWPSLYQCQK